MGYSSEVPEALFRRCVTGCGDTTPTCPVCPAGEQCSLVPMTCQECQKTVCVSAALSPSQIASPSVAKNSGPNTGAIAGGVIAGVVVIGFAVYLVWRFCIRPKRQQFEQEDWAVDAPEYHDEEAEKQFNMRRDARASTHTVGSIASTVLTRASNIIQIAYIPGVTNRSAPSTPGVLVPPVPPIPIALSGGGSIQRYEQEHFFMPGDLRDSTWSGMSDGTDRTSYARNSVASTIYGKNAVVSPVPAQTVIRGKAAVVSVKSNGHGSGELTPPVPSVDYGKYSATGPPSPAFSVGSTFLNSATASAAAQVRPQVVRVTTGSKKTTASTASHEDDYRHSPLTRDSNAITIIDDTPAVEQGPFQDPPQHHKGANSLSAVITNAQNGKGLAISDRPERAITPFGDEHELKD